MRKHIAVSSVVPSLLATSCFHAHGFVARPFSTSHLPPIQATVKTTTEPPEQEDVDDETAWYAPPDFTIEDEDSFEEDKIHDVPPDYTILEDEAENEETVESATKEYIPPDVTIDDDSETVESLVKAKSQRVAKKQSDSAATNMQQPTSWMEKNAKFSLVDESPPPPKQQPRKQQRRKGEQNRTFRQDFRCTRVFVQGLNPDTTWQQLKDHFRLAGEVVFASVSVDAWTGESKQCGVVQYETTEMAQNAIHMMRDHPLDGATLFVREDVQEGKQRLRNPTPPRGDQKKSTIPQSWTCADESTTELLSQDEKTAIYSLIRARDEARKRRNYDASDDMREELKFKFGVHLDDRLKMWWVSPDGRRVPQAIADIKGDGRWGSLKPWRQIPTTPENDACVDPDLVNGLLMQRDIARREKDFSTADALLEEARTSPDGDLNLRIHDESRTWRIWTEKPPPREIMYGTATRSERKTPAEQCIDIVSEYAPEKVPEIENMLKKFPGREYNILKKLKQRYLNR